MFLENSKCLVLKIGSALLVDEDQARINETWLTSLVADVNGLVAQGTKVVIVTSGAIAVGKLVLALSGSTLTLDGKQAAAAVGQIQLINLYQNLLAQHDLVAAQVLLTLDDTENRQRFLNLRNTLHKLLELNIVPIVNENDSVATGEIRYGDNDRLAARVAQMLEADTLVLLSDVAGLYTDNPHTDPTAQLITDVESLTPEIMAMGKTSGSQHGTGGMITKLHAAKIAMDNGCRMLITSGRHSAPLSHFKKTKQGTWFHAHGTPAKAKQRWLQHHLLSQGKIFIDDGAQKALLKGASLLPIGIKKVVGPFRKGSPVTIYTHDKQPLAKGLCNYCSDELQKIIGKQSVQIADILNYQGCHEAVHRDNLVLIGNQ